MELGECRVQKVREEHTYVSGRDETGDSCVGRSWQGKQGMESKARLTVQSSMVTLPGAGPGAGDAELLQSLRTIHEALGLIPSTVV